MCVFPYMILSLSLDPTANKPFATNAYIKLENEYKLYYICGMLCHKACRQSYVKPENIMFLISSEILRFMNMCTETNFSLL